LQALLRALSLELENDSEFVAKRMLKESFEAAG
jgi:hypothetical protein